MKQGTKTIEGEERMLFKHFVSRKKLAEQMNSTLRIQGSDGNWNYDDYLRGMFNGMELMVAIVEDRAPACRPAPDHWVKDKYKDEPAGEPVARSAEEWLESPLHDGLIANIVAQMTREQKIEFGKKVGLNNSAAFVKTEGEKEVKEFRLLNAEYKVFQDELSKMNGPVPITSKLNKGGVETEKELIIRFEDNYVFLSNVPEATKRLLQDNDTLTVTDLLKDALSAEEKAKYRGPRGVAGVEVAEDKKRVKTLKERRGMAPEKCVNEYCDKFYDPSHPYCPVCKKDRLTGVFLDFGQAIDAMKAGKKVKREAWGGYWAIEEWEKIDLETSLPLIVAYLKDNEVYAPAQPYQADILAEDWVIVE